MTAAEPTYDLVLVLDPQAEEAARAKIVADAVSAIEAQGQLVSQESWGERPLSYPIDRHANGEYHLLQFHAPVKQLLADLDHTLRITDDVLRFRIVKLAPGTPPPPDMGAAGRRAESPASETPVSESPASEIPVAETPEAPEPDAVPELA
jgi:small subunit ribosomal protein S6